MKIRIKKIPLETELNARHWKHDDGGHLFLEDGLMNTNLLTLFDKYGPNSLVIQIDKPIRLNEVLVVANAPKPGDFNYDKYIANTYDAWKRGNVDINTLPTETRNRVRGYSGTIAALKGMDTAAKVAGITAAIPVGIIGGISFAPTAWSIINNPIVDAGLTVHGAINAPKNIREGVQELQEGNYGRGALDLGLTALDLYGAGNLAFRLGRIANPAYRAKHAYNTIAPVSYKNMSKRGYEWLKDLWNNPSIDYSNPKWYLNLKEQPFLIGDVDYLGYTKTGSYLPEDVLHAGKIADEARIDAWALYNRLPLQYGTYIKNADGTYSYNMKKIMLDSEGTWHPLFEPELSGEKSRMHDFVTGAGGGLTDFRLIESGNHGNGIMHLEDVWDLNPFSRVEDTFQHRLANKAIEKLGSQTRRDAVLNFRKKMFDKGVFSVYNNSGIHKITYPIDRILNRYRMGEFAPKFKINDYEHIVGLSDKIIHDLSNSRLVSKISNKLNDFEIGRISGGKPFKMSTDIPYHKRGLDDYLIDSDTAPFIKTPKEPIGALTNEPLRYGFNPNWIAYTQPIQSKYLIEPKIDIQDLLNNIITKK